MDGPAAATPASRKFGFEPFVEAAPVDAARPEQPSPKGSRVFGVAPIDGPVATAAPTADTPWSDVAGRAVTNFPSSAWNVAKSTVEPFLSPIETAKNLGQIGKGLYSKAEGLVVNQDPAKKAEDERMADAVGKFYSDRYGTMGGFKKAVAEDPAGVLSDVTAPLTLGGAMAAKAPGVVGTVGRVAKGVGEAIDPISGAAKVAAKGVEGVGHLASLPLTLKTGVPVRNLRDAVRAGYTSNPVFGQFIKGEREPSEIVNTVQSAVSQIAKERSDAYNAGMAGVRANQTMLPYDKVTDAFNEARNIALTPNGLVMNQKALDALTQARTVIEDWMGQSQVPGAHTMQDFDFLKRRLDELRFDQIPNSPAEKAIKDIRESVYKTIEAADPSYAKTMDEYSKTTQLLSELNKEVTGGSRTSVGAKLRKILKSQDDAHKGKLLDELVRINPDLPYMIAGAELRSIMPKGLVGRLGAMGIGAAYGLTNPAATAAMVLTSPRVAGGLEYGIGRAAKGIRQVGDAASPAVRAAPYAAGELSERVQEAPPLTIRPDKRPTRSHGGAVTAESLLSIANRAKKRINEGTKAILTTPDESVAGALRIAASQGDL